MKKRFTGLSRLAAIIIAAASLFVPGCNGDGDSGFMGGVGDFLSTSMATTIFNSTTEATFFGNSTALPANPETANLTPGSLYYLSGQDIVYMAGNLPVILSVPHGGIVVPSGVSDHPGTTVTDINTQEIALDMKNQMNTLTGGRYPHIIFNRIKRAKLDPNRSISSGEAYVSSSTRMATAYGDFHNLIRLAKTRCINEFGASAAGVKKCLFIDVHGQSYTITQLGYDLVHSELTTIKNNTSTTAYDNESSVTPILDNTADTLYSVLMGPNSFGAYLSASTTIGSTTAQFSCVPSPNNKTLSTLYSAYYMDGDYDIEQHCRTQYNSTEGHTESPVPGFQLEIANSIRTSATNRDNFTYIFARAVRQFMNYYMGIDITALNAAVAPAAPSGLSASAASSSQVNLAWIDNSSNETGFKIERSGNGGSTYAQIATTTASSYSDTGLAAGTIYYYRVRAYNTAGDSSYSGAATATTQAGVTIPAAPSGLSASAASTSQINLAWTDNSANETGFRVERSSNGGSTFTQVAATTANSYSNTGLAAGTTYLYRVCAYNSAGNSAYSGSVSATTLASSTPTVATYTFNGVTVADAYNNAYENDVDQFPFGGNSANRNDHTEGTAAQYTAISASDNSRWATDDPDSYDEMMFWVEMLIEEDPAGISRIDFTFEGYPSETGTVGIWVLKAGADWTADASWVSLGSTSISSGSDGTLTCSLTANIANYIQSDGRIIWVVGAAEGHSDSLYIDYVKVDVTYTE